MSDKSFDWQISEYMIYCRSRQFREKTMNSYEQALRLFERWCTEQMGVETVDKVTEGIVRRYWSEDFFPKSFSFFWRKMEHKQKRKHITKRGGCSIHQSITKFEEAFKLYDAIQTNKHFN